MFCPNCGQMIEDNAKFCGHCGSAVQAETAPVSYAPQGAYGSYTKPAESASVGFGTAIKLFFQNYANFSGRSRRSEYWWACLFNAIASLVIGNIPVVGFIWAIGVIVPGISLCVRRLHDIGKSGWWWFISMIPLAGGIIMLIWMCKDSEPGANQWGPSPKY